MTTTEHEIEPAYVAEQRWRERLEEATRAASDAADAERDQFQEVDRLRGDLGLGLAQRGDLLRAQRRLSRCQTATGDAESLQRAVTRDTAREREARHSVDVAAARQERRALEAQKALSRERDAASNSRPQQKEISHA